MSGKIKGVVYASLAVMLMAAFTGGVAGSPAPEIGYGVGAIDPR